MRSTMNPPGESGGSGVSRVPRRLSFWILVLEYVGTEVHLTCRVLGDQVEARWERRLLGHGAQHARRSVGPRRRVEAVRESVCVTIVQAEELCPDGPRRSHRPGFCVCGANRGQIAILPCDALSHS